VAQRVSGVAGGVPLFTSLFNYRHNAVAVGDGESAGGSGGIRTVFLRERTNYPLSVSVDDGGEGLWLTVDAVAPADPQAVCGMLHTAIENLVDALEAGDDAPLTDVDVLDNGERRRVLSDWSDTAVDVVSSTLPGLFVEQVARTP